MKKPLHIIYVPGLGDSRVKGQRWAVAGWRWYGIEAELFQMNWGDGEAWPPKFKRLLSRIDELATENKTVALVGASAGGSAVINAFAARKDVLVGVVCIVGWINHPEALHPSHQQRNPAFVTSATNCPRALASLDETDRQRILSRYAFHDGIVAQANSHITSAHNRTLPTIGHAFTAATQIIFGAPSFIHFLKKQIVK